VIYAYYFGRIDEKNQWKGQMRHETFLMRKAKVKK
jgi:hypothetical protein